MSKNKKDKGNRSTNPRFYVITVKISVILPMNVRTKKNQEFVKSRCLTTEESNMFMAYTEDILMQGVQEMKLYDNLWYLDTGASSHMTSKRSYFHSIDEN